MSVGGQQRWDAGQYARAGGFVPRLGQPAVDLLDPRPGERVLDLGCGDGTLTLELAARGAAVVGVDSSPSMVEAARARGLDARLLDARELAFEQAFDAVFSNAALHWIPERDHDRVLAAVARALVPGGRFVAEMGGHGNIAAINVAVAAALRRRGIDPGGERNYYPAPDEYAERLERAGFRVERMEHFPRPTPLPAGMAAWLGTFRRRDLDLVPEPEREALVAEIVELLRPWLCDRRGRWTADYVRLRFAARLP